MNDTQESPKLLPCPFCGWDKPCRQEPKEFKLHYIGCPYCQFNLDGEQDGDVAVAKWNRRANTVSIFARDMEKHFGMATMQAKLDIQEIEKEAFNSGVEAAAVRADERSRNSEVAMTIRELKKP